MPILIDDQVSPLAGATLGEIIDAASRQVEARGRVVVEVHLNGESLIGDEIEKKRASNIGGGEVRLITANPRELAAETLGQVLTLLNDARDAQAQAAELFQQDNAPEAIRQIGRAVEVWQQTQQAVLFSSMLVGLKLDDQKFDNEPLTAMTDGLLRQITELRDMLAANDTVALADSLGFEWPEMTDRWQRMIHEMIGWITTRQ